MPALLFLEAIGDNINDLRRSFFGKALGMGKPRVPWVARLTGFCPRYGYKRDFVPSEKDYADANSVGSRGVMLCFELPDGVYEVRKLVSWTSDRRYFIRVSGEEISEITKEELDLWFLY